MFFTVEGKLKMPKITKLLMLSAAIVGLSGCASMLHGTYEKIAISSSPEQSLCKIYREGHGYVKSVATPGETYIMRDSAPITITCSKSGYQTTSVVVATARGEQDNIANVVTLGTGFFVDVANATQDQLPDEVHIQLSKQ